MCCGVFAQKSGKGPAIEDENNKRLKAVVKMFFVMGPTWLAEILHFALKQGVKECHVNKVVILFDIINCLQVIFQKIKQLYYCNPNNLSRDSSCFVQYILTQIGFTTSSIYLGNTS